MRKANEVAEILQVIISLGKHNLTNIKHIYYKKQS